MGGLERYRAKFGPTPSETLEAVELLRAGDDSTCRSPSIATWGARCTTSSR